MSKLNLLQIQLIFDKIKLLAQKEFENRNYEKSLKYIETAADVAYSFNWKYSDEILENLLIKISNVIIDEKKSFIPIKGRIVLYDVFASDNKGLTQQYLRALISWGVELLFIFEGKDLSRSKQIVSEINSYSKAELFVVDASLTKAEKIKCVYNKIIDFKPEKAFLHLYPSSVVAVTLWNALQEITRYQINLTDHAFWLGTKCIDYCLEFRDYGCTVSHEKRNLSKDKLLIQPYYPIIECQPFIGFPPEVRTDAIKIFTGGAYYKMYGKAGMFFELLKTLIKLDAKVIILIAGSGNALPLKEFIKNNNFENRVFLLGSRPDITHIFENCDIYLSTYPLTGGLMGQYAASLAKPILSYTSLDFPCNFSEGFINWKSNSDFKITDTNLDSFKAKALKFIKNKLYREKKGQENKNHLITKKEFSDHLKQLVTYHKMEVPFKEINIDYSVFSEYYIECENKYLNQFDFLVLSRFKLKTIFLDPKFFVSAIFNKKMMIKIFILFKSQISYRF
ncbi:MAG: hypothetical protein ACOH1N_11365 [Lutibacter sp.]